MTLQSLRTRLSKPFLRNSPREGGEKGHEINSKDRSPPTPALVFSRLHSRSKTDQSTCSSADYDSQASSPRFPLTPDLDVALPYLPTFDRSVRGIPGNLYTCFKPPSSGEPPALLNTSPIEASHTFVSKSPALPPQTTSPSALIVTDLSGSEGNWKVDGELRDAPCDVARHSYPLAIPWDVLQADFATSLATEVNSSYTLWSSSYISSNQLGDQHQGPAAVRFMAWITQLTTRFDPNDQVGFWICYRRFIDPCELLQILISRINWSMDSQCQIAPSAQSVIRARSFRMLRFWVKTHYMHDFVPSLQLRRLIQDFLNTSRHSNRIKNTDNGTRLLQSLHATLKAAQVEVLESLVQASPTQNQHPMAPVEAISCLSSSSNCRGRIEFNEWQQIILQQPIESPTSDNGTSKECTHALSIGPPAVAGPNTSTISSYIRPTSVAPTLDSLRIVSLDDMDSSDEDYDERHTTQLPLRDLYQAYMHDAVSSASQVNEASKSRRISWISIDENDVFKMGDDCALQVDDLSSEEDDDSTPGMVIARLEGQVCLPVCQRNANRLPRLLARSQEILRQRSLNSLANHNLKMQRSEMVLSRGHNRWQSSADLPGVSSSINRDRPASMIPRTVRLSNVTSQEPKIITNAYGSNSDRLSNLRPAIDILKGSAKTWSMQLTLLDRDMLRQISLNELMDSRWLRPETKSAVNDCTSIEDISAERALVRMLAWSRLISRWVTQSVVTAYDKSVRQKILRKFICIAHGCLRLRNLSTSAAIYRGLKDVLTVNCLGQKHSGIIQHRWRRLVDTFSSERRYQNLRDLTYESRSSCAVSLNLEKTTVFHELKSVMHREEHFTLIPNIDLLLYDMIELSQAQPTFLSETREAVDPFINIRKVKAIGMLLNEFLQMQKAAAKYKSSANERLLAGLQGLTVPTHSELAALRELRT